MNIKRRKLNIALGHLIAGLFFFSGLMFFPLEEPSGHLIATLALVPTGEPRRTGKPGKSVEVTGGVFGVNALEAMRCAGLHTSFPFSCPVWRFLQKKKKKMFAGHSTPPEDVFR